MNTTAASDLVGKDQCPECRKLGRDNSKDNLATYRDGHQWCFSCGYYVPASLEHRIRSTITRPDKGPRKVELPFDASINIPANVMVRLGTWGLDEHLVKKHRFLWSETKRRLIMPVYGPDGELLMYQERSWDIGLPKYLTNGLSSDILHILYPEGEEDDRSVVILTEDLVSAIKVSQYKPAMPLWGSDIPLKTIKRLASQFHVVGVWLDPDMKLKAVKDVLRISQYVPAFFVHSNLDPKFYSKDSIKEHIDIAGYKMMFKNQESRAHSAEQQGSCVLDKSLVCVTDDEHVCNCKKNPDGTTKQWQTKRLEA